MSLVIAQIGANKKRFRADERCFIPHAQTSDSAVRSLPGQRLNWASDGQGPGEMSLTLTSLSDATPAEPPPSLMHATPTRLAAPTGVKGPLR